MKNLPHLVFISAYIEAYSTMENKLRLSTLKAILKGEGYRVEHTIGMYKGVEEESLMADLLQTYLYFMQPCMVLSKIALCM